MQSILLGTLDSVALPIQVFRFRNSPSHGMHSILDESGKTSSAFSHTSSIASMVESNASSLSLSENSSPNGGVTQTESSPVVTPRDVPSREIIDKITLATKRKSAILLPNAVPARGERGTAIGIVTPLLRKIPSIDAIATCGSVSDKSSPIMGSEIDSAAMAASRVPSASSSSSGDGVPAPKSVNSTYCSTRVSYQSAEELFRTLLHHPQFHILCRYRCPWFTSTEVGKSLRLITITVCLPVWNGTGKRGLWEKVEDEGSKMSDEDCGVGPVETGKEVPVASDRMPWEKKDSKVDDRLAEVSGNEINSCENLSSQWSTVAPSSESTLTTGNVPVVNTAMTEPVSNLDKKKFDDGTQLVNQTECATSAEGGKAETSSEVVNSSSPVEEGGRSGLEANSINSSIETTVPALPATLHLTSESQSRARTKCPTSKSFPTRRRLTHCLRASLQRGFVFATSSRHVVRKQCQARCRFLL